jgi:hypothetical protein
VAICEESHFLVTQFVGYPIRRPGFRQKFAQVGDISTEAGARHVVDYIYGALAPGKRGLPGVFTKTAGL